MGPRSFERGDLAGPIRPDRAGRAFNGAALFRARRRAGRTGFTGQNPFLQWGRALSSAETRTRRGV